MTLEEKAKIALTGVVLTKQQAGLLCQRLDNLVCRKAGDEITIPEIQGLTKIVQTVLPAGIDRQASNG